MNHSIAENLRRINRETSLRLGAAADAPPARTGRMKILALAFGAFLRSFLAQKNFGKEGYIRSGVAAVEAIVRAVKVWEFAFRRSKGEKLPPAGEAEVNRLSSRYASWTPS